MQNFCSMSYSNLQSFLDGRHTSHRHSTYSSVYAYRRYESEGLWPSSITRAHPKHSVKISWWIVEFHCCTVASLLRVKTISNQTLGNKCSRKNENKVVGYALDKHIRLQSFGYGETKRLFPLLRKYEISYIVKKFLKNFVFVKFHFCENRLIFLKNANFCKLPRAFAHLFHIF